MFRLLHTNEERIPKVEFFLGKLGEVFLYGEALTFEQNRLTKCTEDKKPLFICLNDTSCKRKSKRVSVLRISKNYLFECPIDEESEPLKAGDLVRLSDDARGVKALDKEQLTICFNKIRVLEVKGDKATVLFCLQPA